MTLIKNILVVGAGPSACYVIQALQKQFSDINIDVIDSHFSPFGLLRTGVAPDHIKIKSLQTFFNKILCAENVSFFGNVTFGKDLLLSDVSNAYHAIFICTGTQRNLRLSECDYSLPNVSGSRHVVNWYNGYDNEDSTFTPLRIGSNVGIIGLGNVALDIARIFLKTPDQLLESEIPKECINILSNQNISNIHIFARRGPAQAKCTPFELNELIELPHINVSIPNLQPLFTKQDQIEIEETSRVKKNAKCFQTLPLKRGHKNLFFHFFSKLHKVEQNRNGLMLTLNKTKLTGQAHQQSLTTLNEQFTKRVDSLVTCIGYLGNSLPDLPFNSKTACIPHTAGRVLPLIQTKCLVYVAGWIKRGAQGVIGTNKAGANETVNTFINDVKSENFIDITPINLSTLLNRKSIKYYSINDWKKQSEYESILGKEHNKPRLKITTIKDLEHMLNL